MPLPPPTAIQLDAVAARAPQRLAVHDEDGPLSYGEFRHRVVRCAELLVARGFRAGDRVAIAGPGVAIQLLVSIAVEGLGGVTSSFAVEGDPGAARLFAAVQWVIARIAQVVPPGVRNVVVDDAFLHALRQPLDGAGSLWIDLPAGAPTRLARTSGSSGPPKFLLHDRTGFEWWLASAYTSCLLGQGADSRMLVLCPMVVGGAYARACACLRIGAAVLAGHRLDLAALRPTSMFGLSAHLQGFLAAVPPGAALASPIAASIVGGAVPRPLREQAAAVLRTPIHNRYGLNEAGPVCEEVDADGVGRVLAGVEFRILGDDGVEVAPGQVGTIALRTPAVAAGYLDGDGQANAAAFRGGWFITSDAGACLAPGVLRLVGRRDDMVILGGVKSPSSVLEQRLVGLASVAAGAVLSVQLDGGSTTLGIVVVLPPGRGLAGAQAELEAAFADVASMGIRLMAVESLPTLPGGKVDRAALLKLFLARAGQP